MSNGRVVLVQWLEAQPAIAGSGEVGTRRHDPKTEADCGLGAKGCRTRAALARQAATSTTPALRPRTEGRPGDFHARLRAAARSSTLTAPARYRPKTRLSSAASSSSFIPDRKSTRLNSSH